MTHVTPMQADAQANAIGGTITEKSYTSVSKVRNNILAVKNSTLSILSPQLAILSKVGGLNYPYSVTGVEAFPVYQDKDGDPKTSELTTLDLAMVSTKDGLLIIDVTNPSSPKEMNTIPEAGGKIVVDRQRRLAYNGGLTIFSLKNLKYLKDIEKSGDRIDDRVLYKYPDAKGINVLSDDGSLLYAADYLDGKVKVVKLYPDQLELEISVSYGGGEPERLTLSNNKIYIKNNYALAGNDKGNPEMPTITCRAKIRDAEETDPDYALNENLINWEIKVDYKVNIPGKKKHRSRGLDKTTKDGFQIKQTVTPGGNPLIIDKALWGDIIGGGTITITATAPNLLDNHNIPFSGKFGSNIEGQTFAEDPLFKESITTYLEAPIGVSDYNSILTELDQSKFFRIIGYKESDPWAGKYSHFERLSDNIWKNLGAILGYSSDYVYPVVNKDGTSNKPTSDGGFGLMQLTNPKPTYEQIWNYKLNIDRGVELIRSKLEAAKSYPEFVRTTDCIKDPERTNGKTKYYCFPIQNKDPEASDFNTYELRMDTYSLYNSNWHYWKWKNRKEGWQPRLKKGKYSKGTGSHYADEAGKIEKNAPKDF